MPPVSLLGLLRFSAVVASFGTINEPILLGQHNEHEMITRLAFQCPSGQKSDGICFEPRSLDQLAGYHRDVLGLAIPGAGFNGAVGAPDTLDLVPEGPEAHCDDADYLDIPGYPQTRAEATANLHACVEHLRGRFRQAWVAAGRLLDERKRIRPAMVELSNPFGDCTFAFPALQGSTFARAKCSVLEGFGRALHGIQDFYSHSNWADNADPKLPISVSNPPGLGRTDAAPFLDLRARGVIPPDQIPLNLTTGCFALPDTSPGSGECAGRITHYALNKDAGLISLDGSIGEMGPVSPRSEAVPSNFRLAVHAAIQSSRHAWGDLREEMRLQYGAVSGNLIICSLVRDDPIKDCRNRTVAVVVDKSWESSIEGGIQLERSLAKELNSRLTLHGLDRVAVIEFDESARLVYPMGYPISATFDFSEPGGQRRIDSGIKLAMAETIHAQPETYSDRGAILLLTTGSESGQSAENTLIQLRNATEEGVRVHYGCVSPAGRWNDHAADTSGGTVCSLGDALVPAVLKTGGIVAFIHSHGPITLGHFINLVMDRGLTATDAKDAAEHTRVYPGISVFDLLSDQYPTKSFVYPVSAGENLNFTIQSTVPEGLDTTGCFSVALWNKGLEIKIATYTSCCSESPLSLVYEATAAFDLMLVAEHGDTTGDSDEGEIVFMLELDTSKPDKNETRTTRSIEILSTSTIVELAGSTTRTVLTSETLEVISGTAIAGGSTSTFSQCFRADNDGGPFYHSSSEPKPTCGMETISATTMASNLTSASRSSPGHSPLVYT